MRESVPSGREQLRRIARHAMLDRGLQPDFPPDAVAEAATARAAAPGPESAVADLRHLSWSSIDNDDTRDLDQLSAAEPLAGGAVRILVAVADVDAAVPAGSAVDRHARVNTTSVYTAAEIFPMLPERYSTDLTSLGEHEPRLAIVVSLTVGPDGTLTASDVSRALVLNRAKLTYHAVGAWLDGDGPEPLRLASVPGLDDQLRLQDRAARGMRGLRHRHGAMEFQTIEAAPVFEGDRLTGLRTDDRTRAKELIEDLMIAANTATAEFLESRGLPSLRRVLKAPARWDRIVALARELGERLPDAPDASALQAMMARRRAADPAHFPDLSLSIVKLLGSGEYSVDRPGQSADGHFGLAVRDYTHSTAPNRRYPDLVTQRLVKAALDRTPPPYGDADLDALARHCTEQEDNAAKVERQVRKSAAALLLAPKLGERFDAIVTGASGKGTWVRVLRPPVEGRVVDGYQGLDVGDRVTVRLVDVDVERGFVDFAARGRT